MSCSENTDSTDCDWDFPITQENEITRLRAELSEAERDAARYRWIRDCLWSPIKDEMELQIGPLYFLRSDYQPKDIDWTIDAAMAREEG